RLPQGARGDQPAPDPAEVVQLVCQRESDAFVYIHGVRVAQARSLDGRGEHLKYVHKDTVFKLGCGMFVEECRKRASEYPDVLVDDVIVDTFAMRLGRDPASV